MKLKARTGKRGKSVAIGLIMIIMVALCACILCSCAPKKEKIVGTWTSEDDVYLDSYGTYGKRRLVFNEDKTVVSTLIKSSTGKTLKYDDGTWEIDGKTIKLYMNSDAPGTTTNYEYKSGKLISGNWTLTKADDASYKQVEEAISSSLSAQIAIKMAFGQIPSGWYYNGCTYNITEIEDGSYYSSGKVYLISGGQSASAYYTIELGADLKSKSVDIGTFYKD